MQNKIDVDKVAEILASLFREKQEISVVVNGVKTVLGYTQPKTFIFNSDLINLSEVKLPKNTLAYIRKEKGKTVLRVVEIHPPSLVEKLLAAKR